MSQIEEYIYKDNKKLRLGYTTGSCAAAAAKAASIMLLSGSDIKYVDLMTPKGIGLKLKVLEINKSDEYVSCAIQKDSGDDPDITNGMLIFAKVRKIDEPKVVIDGGIGVGRVTKKGLEQAIGEAAINRVPRSMIENEVKSIIEELEYKGGIEAVISIPKGEEIARKTFNPRLGIVGGISILGTSGIVEPMSEKALTDSIRIEMKMLHENGAEYVLVTPGNYGEAFASETLGIDIEDSVKCSNFVGDVLDYALEFKFKGILLIGHVGKFVKLSGGIMNTHSRYADCRVEILTANAALEGADRSTLEKIMNSITTDDAIEYLDKAGLREDVFSRIGEKIDYHINQRVYNELKVGAIVFSNKYGLLCETKHSKELIKHFRIREI
ncbi:cobalt-precorrin-5B (C(1))-methyltransferase CbiD [Clostridium cylindrosporum]|uniref:Cobalt-precorrin-5B C(1)-methyltransferase n=1 Tax=Clostridium cylindrosporum DSM 605 TaxID=1121307 RepID=A0A0J8D7G0_CLOCY|nr:cobalt-precorrin-5B (C(1))-methyltransferase CbiD [Clostridium cylindrosporum]KMT21832.1 cobalt-precorrin-5B C(1)-methyltransferase CbiD [Clostridium cylindrosporum DSM 605]